MGAKPFKTWSLMKQALMTKFGVENYVDRKIQASMELKLEQMTRTWMKKPKASNENEDNGMCLNLKILNRGSSKREVRSRVQSYNQSGSTSKWYQRPQIEDQFEF
ncbi:hypothetical protein M9H77_08449 [Catharanthus roseus]|uniref:Uncharacterized protein n=1 Tax=Catharanthus roseus TaxID=4058 RepID=A0ACC0BXZ1_CATRO|nr:hypothetical protein M9H77_08449 [Catharanthus roseus]